TLHEALEVASQSNFGPLRRDLARAAQLARTGEPLETVLGAAFGRDARELVPLVLLEAGNGVPAAFGTTAVRLRERALARLRALLLAAEPLAV
ncbi:type II secretion system F family protein, partial [Klebsiella pneumoniae]|nr:type II secretion system F family protein [Klebsiella pneumoniae]